MSKNIARRKPSSSGATARPRKLAGQGAAAPRTEVSTADAPVLDEPVLHEPVLHEPVLHEPVLHEPVRDERGRDEPVVERSAILAPEAPEPAVEPAVAQPPAAGAGSGSPLAGRRVTRLLVVVLALLGVVLAVQGVWFARHEPAPVHVDDTTAAERAELDVPDGRPVVANEADALAGVDAAAKALDLVVSRNFKSYDRDVEKAAATMTERFAAEYRTTTDQIRDEFIANRTAVQSRVVAQGVVRATDTQVEALIFLNQYTTKGEKGQERTTYTPYRAVVTVVNTDRGWLVDGLDTK
ncbi:hypothetical protein E8D34_15145 [Nocardioides sp. GY 10113]|uniref:hypothetical protein n=1 Tax=Nocardioides sp. GY 10113 TaxID=2569761 RepID=UPI0010A78962|nr:hypothetical protein [Nocardioides sp. GY 10113]TIC83890.1 hypothetical protein E8D34_15145 [Nocardioides sp. GY 10113]